MRARIDRHQTHLFSALSLGVFLLIYPAWASALTLDLTSEGSSGTINGAIFEEGTVHPAGSGVIDSFVRIGDHGVTAGYNTDGEIEFETKPAGCCTRSILLDAVPVVSKGGVDYREFFLDINQSAKKPFLSLDELEIYLGSEPDLTGYPNLGTLVYDLDAGADNWIKLDYRLNSGGSGSADMFAYIPDVSFTGPNPYVYLYSRFGEHHTNNAGFEEWAVRNVATASVPEPSTLLLLGSGLLGLGLWRGKRV